MVRHDRFMVQLTGERGGIEKPIQSGPASILVSPSFTAGSWRRYREPVARFEPPLPQGGRDPYGGPRSRRTSAPADCWVRHGSGRRRRRVRAGTTRTGLQGACGIVAAGPPQLRSGRPRRAACPAYILHALRVHRSFRTDFAYANANANDLLEQLPPSQAGAGLLMLPGLNGYELARRLRAMNAAIRLIALTGCAQASDVQVPHEPDSMHIRKAGGAVSAC